MKMPLMECQTDTCKTDGSKATAGATVELRWPRATYPPSATELERNRTGRKGSSKRTAFLLTGACMLHNGHTCRGACMLHNEHTCTETKRRRKNDEKETRRHWRVCWGYNTGLKAHWGLLTVNLRRDAQQTTLAISTWYPSPHYTACAATTWDCQWPQLD